MFSTYNDTQELITLSTDKYARALLKTEYANLTKRYKEDKDDYALLDTLFEKIELLEKELLNKKSEQDKKKNEENAAALKKKSHEGALNKFGDAFPQLVKEKDKLEKDDLAFWRLYSEGIELATSLLKKQDKSAKKLGEELKIELKLLTSSVEFTTKAARGNVTPAELEEGTRIASAINTHIEPFKKDMKDIKRIQGFLKFAMAMGLVLILAAAAALIIGLTGGIAAIPIGLGVALYVGCSLAGGGAMLYTGIKHSELSTEKKQIEKKSVMKLPRFHKAAEELAKEKQVNKMEPSASHNHPHNTHKKKS